LHQHLADLHDFYGQPMGVRIARKHLGWYLNGDSRLTESDRRRLKAEFNGLEAPATQYRFIVKLLSHDFTQAASGAARPVSPDGTSAA
jgi:tRNA-dihydrouridine synthase B